jgi:hypothetical protein
MGKSTEEGWPQTAQVGAHTCGVPHCPQVERATGGLQELYACTSPTVIGKIERKIRVKMLIDSGSKINVISKGLW